MPGTHSKHLAIADGAIRDFRTFMTGELFDVAIGTHASCVTRSAPCGETGRPAESGPPDRAFAPAWNMPGECRLAAALFRVRTRQLLDGQPADATARFSAAC